MPRIRINNIKADIETPEEEVLNSIRPTLPQDASNLQLVKKSLDARNKNHLYYIYTAEYDIPSPLSLNVIPRGNAPSRDLPAPSTSPSPEEGARGMGKTTHPPLPAAAKVKPVALPPVVVGSGPAGMMAALCLAEAGLNPIIIERGASVDERKKAVAHFWQTGELSEQTNVQFGEGGAGTFSDGKLMTGIKKDEYTAKVLNEFAAAGAPKEILYLAKPHIGTDKLVTMTKNIREKIIALGGTYYFNTQLTDITPNPETNLLTLRITPNSPQASFPLSTSHPSNRCRWRCHSRDLPAPSLSPSLAEGARGMGKTTHPLNSYSLKTDTLILALGHSARDTFKMLYNRGVEMTQKPFAVGVRIEHKQAAINLAQYGKKYHNSPYLGAADYKLAAHLPDNRNLYTFCMCPGGTVVAATSIKGHVVTNGMSEFARDKENANAALLVNVDERDFGSTHPLAGIEFQEKLEKRAFELGGKNYYAPVQTVGDLLAGKPTKKLGSVTPSYAPGVTPSDFKQLFPEAIYKTLQQGIKEMDKKLRGFADKNAVLTAVESRSSSPVRIWRDENHESNIKGIYPIGEGAGYAGGITSAAADGVKTAHKILSRL